MQLNIPSASGRSHFKINPVTLSFHDPEMEKRFQESYLVSNLQLGRACHLVAVFFFSMVGIWDAFVIDPSRQQTWALVIPVVALFFFAGLFSSFYAFETYARFWKPLYAFYVLLTGTAFTAVSVLSHENYPIYNFVGIIFCLIFCYKFIRLTFLWAVCAGNAIVFIYFAGVALMVAPSTKLLYTDFFYIFGINLLGMVVCYSLERLARRDFILNYLLEKTRNEMADLNVQLEQKVSDRTQALEKTNHELKETIKREKRLSGRLDQIQKMESIGRLAGGVAHDYNNISTAIIGYSELAMLTLSEKEPVYEYFREILEAANRATAISHQLLAFARKQTITPEVIDLNHTVNNMYKILSRLIGENIELSWMPGAGIWPVKIDPSQVDQMIANLCVNARDAIPDRGKVTIETGTATFDSRFCAENDGFMQGDYVRLSVRDNGKGIPREDMDKIFEPFFTTKAVGEGTGLGLSMVYGIIEQNSGFIKVESETGKGSAVHLYLPRCLEAIPDNTAMASPDMFKGNGESILLVEDDPVILQMETRILERLGYQVVSAGLPSEAVEIAENRKNEFQLLITDVVMPGMNGKELAEELLKICPDIKVIFTSGYTADVIVHNGIIEEGVNFVAKPFSWNDFAEKIRSVLDSG